MKRYRAINDHKYKENNIEIFIEKGEIWNHMGMAPGNRTVINRGNVIITLEEANIGNNFEKVEF